MKPIPLNNEIELVARRIVWFESPEEALADPVRFLAYAMARATHEDMKVIRRYVDDTDFLEALEKTPPGIIDPRSWPTGEVFTAEPGNRASAAMPPKFCAIARLHFPYRPRIIYKSMVIGEQGNALDRGLGHKDAIEGIILVC